MNDLAYHEIDPAEANDMKVCPTVSRPLIAYLKKHFPEPDITPQQTIDEQARLRYAIDWGAYELVLGLEAIHFQQQEQVGNK
jgi:hypothetical protein